VRRTLAVLVLLLASAARAQTLPAGDCAGVYWDLTAVFANGDRLYARALVTREGPGARNAAAFGHWIDPAGARTPFQNGRGEGEFDWTDSERRLRIGSTRLEVGDGAYRFEVDNDKRGVKLALEMDVDPGLPQQALFEQAPEITVLALGAPTRARVWRTGMSAARELTGRATLVRTRHSACESDLFAQRVDVHELSSEVAALLVHERLVGGASRSWFGWREGQATLRSVRPELALEDWRPMADGTPLPRRIRAGGALRGAVAVGDARISIDPLDALPRVVRMLYWFGAHPRRVWADATSDLAGDGFAPPRRGAVVASFTFLRPPDIPSPPSSHSSSSPASASGG
jgi:hypothetical protein